MGTQQIRPKLGRPKTDFGGDQKSFADEGAQALDVAPEARSDRFERALPRCGGLRSTHSAPGPLARQQVVALHRALHDTRFLRRAGSRLQRMVALGELLDVPAVADMYSKEFGQTLRADLHRCLDSRDLRLALRALDEAAKRRLGSWDKRNIEKLLVLRKDGVRSFADVRVQHDVRFGNSVQPLVDVQVSTEGLMPALAGARTSIHILMLEFRAGMLAEAVAELLIKKCREGVAVRLVISKRSSKQQPGNAHFALVDRLIAAGVEVVRQPTVVMGHVHDKLVVVDSKVALLGSWTIVDECLMSNEFARRFDRQNGPRDQWGLPVVPPQDRPRTHDQMIKLQGPVVRDLQIDFLYTWLYHGRPLEPERDDQAFLARYFPPESSRPSPAGGVFPIQIFKAFSWESNPVHRKLLDLMRGAQRTLDVEVTYLMSRDAIAILSERAQAGVKVRLLVPHDGNAEPVMDVLAYRGLLCHYPELLAAGVEIHEYKGYNHGKVVVADGRRTWISSGNPDPIFSGASNGGLACDLCAVIDSTVVAQDIHASILSRDFLPAVSSRITPEFVANLSWYDRLIGQGVRLLYDGYARFFSLPEEWVPEQAELPAQSMSFLNNEAVIAAGQTSPRLVAPSAKIEDAS